MGDGGGVNMFRAARRTGQWVLRKVLRLNQIEWKQGVDYKASKVLLKGYLVNLGERVTLWRVLMKAI